MKIVVVIMTAIVITITKTIIKIIKITKIYDAKLYIPPQLMLFA